VNSTDGDVDTSDKNLAIAYGAKTLGWEQLTWVGNHDILGNVGRTSPNKFGGLDYFGGSLGGGARFDAQGNFIGFLEP
jgi:hypothetical protein